MVTRLETPLVLDGGLGVDAARARLGSVPPETAVVLRCVNGAEVEFRSGRAWAWLELLERHAGGGDVVSVVDGVVGGNPAAVKDVSGGRLPWWFEGVLLDGTAIVGVVARSGADGAGAAEDDEVRTVVLPAPQSAPPPRPAESPPPASAGRGSFLGRLFGGGGARKRGPTRGAGGSRGRSAGSAPPRPPDPAPATRDAQHTGASAEPPPAAAPEQPPPPVAAPAPPPAAAAPESPPRELRAHPLLRPEREVVAPGERFDLTIGLAGQEVPGVRGTQVAVQVPSGADHVDLEVQLVADGFEAPAGWWFRLRAPVSDPDRARIAVPLVAGSDPTPRQCLIEAHFTHDGAPAGVAFCRMAVQPDASSGAAAPRGGNDHGEARAGASGGAGVPWLGTGGTGEILLDPADDPPDLWITISRPDGNEASGRFVWSFHSPHDVDLPRRPLPVELGEDARSFAGRVVRLVAENEGTPLVDEALGGLGRLIRERAPEELGQIISRVADAVGGPPAVLLHSAEALVPWELALLEEPPDPTAPAFLGAQTELGRWLLGPRSVRIPPARQVQVRRMAVVVGDYRSSRNLRLLPEAEAEGAALAERWGARRFTATAGDLDRLLAGVGGAAEVLHFACHGEIDPDDPAAGRIYLNDDQPLDPIHFLQAPIGEGTAPFLFLNACQVGQAGDLLGDYAGFAGSCLRNGFRGFVAPFWSVDDVVARELALAFYERAFRAGGDAPPTVGGILRELRGRFSTEAEIPPSTWLAYTFYGNPRLELKRRS